jgi:hypothetical protein
MSAFEDLQAAWRLRGDRLPWNVSEPVLRALLRSKRVRPSPRPLKPEVARLVHRDIQEARGRAPRPHGSTRADPPPSGG